MSWPLNFSCEPLLFYSASTGKAHMPHMCHTCATHMPHICHMVFTVVSHNVRTQENNHFSLIENAFPSSLSFSIPSVKPMWHMCGICVAHVWHMCGICVAHVSCTGPFQNTFTKGLATTTQMPLRCRSKLHWKGIGSGRQFEHTGQSETPNTCPSRSHKWVAEISDGRRT